jgi:hypothetical protein
MSLARVTLDITQKRRLKRSMAEFLFQQGESTVGSNQLGGKPNGRYASKR